MSFSPLNEVERLLMDAQQGRQSTEALLEGLMEALVYVPSLTPVQADGRGLQPLFYEREGVSQLAIFTERTRIGATFTESAKYCLEIRMGWLLGGMPEGIDLVINPSHPVGLVLSADGIRQLKGRLALQR